MTLTIKTGQRLPAFRLPSMGGTSHSSEQFLGRPALYVGWASWHESRESLPLLQKFYAAHRDKIEVAAIAYDVQGPDLPMRYLRAAGYTFAPLIDSTCELSRLWGAKELPFAVVADAEGVVRLIGGEADEAFLAKVLPSIAKKADKAAAPKPPPHKFVKFEFLLQTCTNFLSRARKDDAVAALKEAAALDPDNQLVLPQALAIANPERFYQGAIDTAWLKQQTARPAKKR